jgi:Ferritin-like domain
VSDEEPASSRRQLLGVAAAAGGLATVELVSACGSSSRLHVGKIPQAVGQSDVDHLNRALGLKQYAVAAYTAAVPLLRGHEHTAAKRFLGQDLAHASQLIGLIKHAGGTPAPARATYDLGHPQGSRGLLKLLDTAENDTIAGFLQLVPKVSPGVVRAELCAILANDAQHVSVLRLSLRRNPIPAAFVTGHE